jgi:hypothetical protein
VAVIVAEPAIENVPAIAAKLALVDPAETVTDPGTVSSELLLEPRLTTAPPLGAAAESDTLQVVDCPELRLNVRQLRADTVGNCVGAVTVNPKLFDVTPLSEAAM